MVGEYVHKQTGTEVRAMLYSGEPDVEELRAFVSCAVDDRRRSHVEPLGILRIEHKENRWQTVYPGDWIVEVRRGEFQRRAAANFEFAYEPLFADFEPEP